MKEGLVMGSQLCPKTRSRVERDENADEDQRPEKAKPEQPEIDAPVARQAWRSAGLEEAETRENDGQDRRDSHDPPRQSARRGDDDEESGEEAARYEADGGPEEAARFETSLDEDGGQGHGGHAERDDAGRERQDERGERRVHGPSGAILTPQPRVSALGRTRQAFAASAGSFPRRLQSPR